MRERQLLYGQCWEDAACLLAALDPGPHSQLLSIASGGENSLALLIRPGVRVLAIDRSPAQIAALELKVAAFRHLDHGEMLQLLGAHPVERQRRQQLYRRCLPHLSPETAAFWERDPRWLGWGVLPEARFERYLGLFRRVVLPLLHGPGRCDRLSRQALMERPANERRAWYDQHWDGWRWRGLFRLFFNRALLGHLGTDPACVRYGEGNQAEALLAEVRRVMVSGDPARNPYLHWILLGRYGTALPLALQPEAFQRIRARLDQLRWRPLSLEAWLEQDAMAEREWQGPFTGFNLSNVLEYMAPQQAGQLLAALHRRAAPGARLVLWNRLARRDASLAPAGTWKSLDPLAASLGAGNQIPFYRRLVVAEALGVPAHPRPPGPDGMVPRSGGLAAGAGRNAGA